MALEPIRTVLAALWKPLLPRETSRGEHCSDRFLGITRSDVPAATVRVIHGARGLRPDVRVVRLGNGVAVLKDYYDCPARLRETVGRWLARREFEAYRRLRGIDGIPEPCGMLDPYAFACQHIEATCGSLFHRHELPPEFFARLTNLVRAIHRRGIAHADLKRRRNFMVDTAFQPYLIDFASAVPRRGRWHFLGNWAFRQLCNIDLNAVAKLKRRVAPELLTDEEKRNLAFPTFLERWAKRVLGR